MREGTAHPTAGDRYRTGWWTVTTVVTGVGVLLAPMTGPFDVLVPIAMAGGTSAAMASAGVRVGREDVHTGAALLCSLPDGLLVGLAVLAGLAYAEVSDALAALLLVVLALSSPAGLRLVGHAPPLPSRARPPTAARGLGDTAAVVAPLLPAMSTGEILRAWRRTYFEVREGSAPDRVAVARQRQCYLDELERRDAAAFAAWLSSSPRAGASPGPFFNAGRKGWSSG